MKYLNILTLLIFISIFGCSKDIPKSKQITFSFKGLPAQMSSKSNGHIQAMVTEPTNLGEFSCFAILTTYPELMQINSCMDEYNDNQLIRPDAKAGMAPFASSGSLDMDVMIGAGRIFHVIGWKTNSGTCYSVDSDFDTFDSDISSAYLLSSTTVDVDATTENIQLTIKSDFHNYTKMGDCNGPLFNWGTSSTTATPTTPVAPTFDPTSVTSGTLSAWYDANDPTTIYADESCTTLASNDGQAIGCWGDKSGNSKNATQLDAGNRPIYQVTGVNALPSLLFDGATGAATADILISSLQTTTSMSIFAVFRSTDTTNLSSSPTIVGVRDSGDSINLSVDGGNRYLNTLLPSYGTSVTTTQLVQDITYLGSMLYADSGTLELFLNNAETNSTAVAALSGSAFGKNLAIGAQYDAMISTDPENEFKGHITEVLIFNAKLSNADRQIVENYLKTKWAIP